MTYLQSLLPGMQSKNDPHPNNVSQQKILPKSPKPKYNNN